MLPGNKNQSGLAHLDVLCERDHRQREGGNACSIPHMGKGKLEKAGKLPLIVAVHPSTPEVAEWIEEAAHLSGDEKDILLPGEISEREVHDLQQDAILHGDDVSSSDAPLDSWERE